MSEQQLVDCAGSWWRTHFGPWDNCVQGGDPVTALLYVQNAGGIFSNANYNYTGHDDVCKVSTLEDSGVDFAAKIPENTKSPIRLVSILNIAFWHEIPDPFESGEKAMAQQIQNSAMSICLNYNWKLDPETGFLVCNQTICNTNRCDVSHCVLLVGLHIGQDPAEKSYWIFKNSWGTCDHPGCGYGYIEYGKNMCGIASLATALSPDGVSPDQGDAFMTAEVLSSSASESSLHADKNGALSTAEAAAHVGKLRGSSSEHFQGAHADKTGTRTYLPQEEIEKNANDQSPGSKEGQLRGSGQRSTSAVQANSSIAATQFTASSRGHMLKWAHDTSYCMSVVDNVFRDGQKMQLWQCADGSGQRFEFDYDKGREGSLLRMAWALDYCVVIDGNKRDNGASIQLWSCDHSIQEQRWISVDCGMQCPFVAFRNAAYDDKCIVVDGNRAHNSNRLQLWSCDTAGHFAHWGGP
jgi:hypothetical protein